MNDLKFLIQTIKRMQEEINALKILDKVAMVAEMQRASALTLTTGGAGVLVQFDTVTRDSILPERSFFPTNNYTMEVPVGGDWAYAFRWGIARSANWGGAEVFHTNVEVNGTIRDTHRENPTSAPVGEGAGRLNLQAGDAITVRLFHNSGANETMQASSGVINSFSLWKITGS